MENNLYTSITGEPFADSGGDVIRFLWSFVETYDKEESVHGEEYIYNPIFNNLLKNINILPAMRNYAENHLFDFDIACKYINATR